VAKKQKTEGVLARETRVRAEADARSAAEQAGAEREAAAQKRVIPPVAKAARPKKAKKARFVREKQEKRTPVKAAELPARSATAGGKMMSKNIKAKPKEESAAGPKDRGTHKRGSGSR
jgi:hypothetical protein